MRPPNILQQRQDKIRYCIAFIHFYSGPHSMIISEAVPTTEIDTVGVYTTKRYMQLQVKDWPKVLTSRLEQCSNPLPSGRKASTLPVLRHAPALHHRGSYKSKVNVRGSVMVVHT